MKKEKKKKEKKEKRVAGESSVESGKNGSLTLGRWWTYQMMYVSHKILEGYSIQCEEHSYGV